MADIIKLVKGTGIHVIEDAAQALGAVGDMGRHAGTMGHMGCFSFFPSKNLGGFGDGGMIVTNDESLARKLRVLRSHGGSPKYYHGVVGGNFRLDAIQAAVLRVKLKYLPSWTKIRREKAERYRKVFAVLDLASYAAPPSDIPGHIYNQFVVRCSNRDGLRRFLSERGVETEIYYPLPLHMQQCFRSLGCCEGEFPHAEAAALESLALPVFPELTDEQLDYVCRQIDQFYKSSSSSLPAPTLNPL
jgi:dTDP-4-amino-4,6-dideoxygalactose transaminase